MSVFDTWLYNIATDYDNDDDMVDDDADDNVSVYDMDYVILSLILTMMIIW